MKTYTIIFAAALATMGLGATAFAQSQFDGAVGARQGQMRIMGLNIGVLGGMARERMDYDAEMAVAAASNLAAASQLNHTFNWPEGSDDGSIEGTRAMPAIWDDMAGLLAGFEAFGAATDGLVAVAGDGLDAMRGALGPVGAACGDCHDSYRTPR